MLKALLDKVKSLTKKQIDAILNIRASHDNLLQAQKHLQEALSETRTDRETQWAHHVAIKLKAAQDAIHKHTQEVRGPEGLYQELQLEAPRLLRKVDRLVEQLEFIAFKAADLAASIEKVQGGVHKSLDRIQPDAEIMLSNLRELMAKETDIIYERFNEPSAMD